MVSALRHFAEKTPKRESHTISTALLEEVATVDDATPTPENGKVTPPRRVANRDRRSREHLTPQEVDKLITAASRIGRYGHRDATLILLAYRHGLRVSELVALRWDQVDLEQGLLHVARLKNGVPSTHPLRGPGTTGAPTPPARARALAVRAHERARRRDDRLVGSKDHRPGR